MTGPVFTMHGPGYRGGRGRFDGVVELLAGGTGLPLHAVHWGDDGVADELVADTVPDGREADAVRDDGATPSTRSGAHAERALDLVHEGIIGGAGGRTAVDDDEVRELMALVQACWPGLRHLPAAGSEVLIEAGAALADLGAGRHGVPVDTRFVRRCLERFDRIAGAGAAATRREDNRVVREQLRVGVARFVGDLLAYRRDRAAVHGRIRAAVAAVDPTLGTEQAPAMVLAHSLGGIVAMDLATAPDPLWVRTMVTLGCQWPLVRLADPLPDGLPHHLPPSLGSWTNVWEPLDPLASAAGTLFRLADGTRPRDVRLSHLPSWGPWTHSTYWRSHEFARLLIQTFGDTTEDSDGHEG